VTPSPIADPTGGARLPTLDLEGDGSSSTDVAAAAREEPLESPELAAGAQLREHLQLGFS
jgi:hypothetical protein